MTRRDEKSWSPYVAGALTGIVLILSVWVADKYVGASTTFVRTAGMIEQQFAPDKVKTMEYFIKEKPIVDWQTLFVAGIFIGSLFAAVMFNDFKKQAVPPMWEKRFGPSIPKRAVFAFLGGAVAMFGARLADGCPSGHGLSGSLQLAVSGFIALICFFVGGMVSARIMYGGGNQK